MPEPRPDTLTFPCPICKNTRVKVGELKCPNPNCGVDLSALARLDTLGQELYKVACTQVKESRNDLALQTLETALAYAPQDAAGWKLLGSLQVQAGRQSEGRASLQKALSLNPEDPETASEIGAINAGLENAARQSKTRRLLWIALPVLAALLLLGYLAYTASSSMLASQSLSETLAAVPPTRTAPTATALPDLASEARSHLNAAAELKGFNLQVTQKGLSLGLSGEVPSAAFKAMAEQLAAGVRGVEAVDSTRLLVKEPQVAEAIQAKLRSDRSLSSAFVTVTQQGADIVLTGVAPTLEVKKMIEAAAAGLVQGGVVDSHLLVVKEPNLVTGVQEALKQEPRTACFALEVLQSGYAVQLKGSVYSALALRLVDELARKVSGVQLVDSSLVKIEPVAREYTVREGDYLELVAKAFYGSMSAAEIIRQANQDKIPLRVGVKIIIPPSDGTWSPGLMDYCPMK